MTPALRALEAELRRLEAAATPAPWSQPSFTPRGGVAVSGPDQLYVLEAYSPHSGDDFGPEAKANAAFVTALRNALPALLDALAKPCPGCVCADTEHRYCPICADALAKQATALATARLALRAVLALPHARREFEYLDKGIGTETEAGRAWLAARAAAEGQPAERKP